MSQFLGSDGARLAMVDDGTSAVGVYMVYSATGTPLCALVYNPGTTWVQTQAHAL